MREDRLIELFYPIHMDDLFLMADNATRWRLTYDEPRTEDGEECR